MMLNGLAGYGKNVESFKTALEVRLVGGAALLEH